MKGTSSLIGASTFTGAGAEEDATGEGELVIGLSIAFLESIFAITVPIGTTLFTSNNISVITPSAVEGISLSTLSVAISNNVSSR